MKTAKQDRQGVRTFAEVMGFATDAQKDALQAKEEAEEVSEKMTHEEIFNLLTKDGTLEGIYRGDDGDLYINASYLRSGIIKADLIDVANLIAQKLNSVSGNSSFVVEGAKADLINQGNTVLSIRSWADIARIYLTEYDSSGNIVQQVHIGPSRIGMGVDENNPCFSVYSASGGDSSQMWLYTPANDKGLDFVANPSRRYITGLTEPVNSTDAVNKAYVDGKVVGSGETVETTTGVLKHSVGNVTYDYPFTYRIIKKANGIAEIYGTSEEIETHITKAWGSLVESGSFAFPIYGFTLTSVLFCNTSFISSAGSSMAWTEGCGNGVTSPGATYLCRADSVQIIKGKLCSYTVGTWK